MSALVHAGSTAVYSVQLIHGEFLVPAWQQLSSLYSDQVPVRPCRFPVFAKETCRANPKSGLIWISSKALEVLLGLSAGLGLLHNLDSGRKGPNLNLDDEAMSRVVVYTGREAGDHGRNRIKPTR